MSIQEVSSQAANPEADPLFVKAAARPRAILADLFERYPDWAQLYEDVDPLLAEREDLLEMLESAPSDLAVMYIYGLLEARVQISFITGRPFL